MVIAINFLEELAITCAELLNLLNDHETLQCLELSLPVVDDIYIKFDPILDHPPCLLLRRIARSDSHLARHRDLILDLLDLLVGVVVALEHAIL